MIILVHYLVISIMRFLAYVCFSASFVGAVVVDMQENIAIWICHSFVALLSITPHHHHHHTFDTANDAKPFNGMTENDKCNHFIVHMIWILNAIHSCKHFSMGKWLAAKLYWIPQTRFTRCSSFCLGRFDNHQFPYKQPFPLHSHLLEVCTGN